MMLWYTAHRHHWPVFGAESSLTQPQMVVMSDTDDPFVPLPDDLLVNLAESRGVIEALLDSLPATFGGNSQVLPASVGRTTAWWSTGHVVSAISHHAHLPETAVRLHDIEHRSLSC